MATILVIDDQPLQRNNLLSLLREQGYRLWEATDGPEALAIARHEQPDLIITNILLPTLDGRALVSYLQAEPGLAQTAVIFLASFWLTREAQALAQACGVSQTIITPTQPEAILQTVQAALGLAPAPPVLSDQNVSTDEQDVARRRLVALLELGQQVMGERDPQSILDQFCRAARTLIGASYAVAGIVAEDKERLRYVSTTGLKAEAAAHLAALPVDQGLPGRLLVEQQPLRLNQLDNTSPELNFLPDPGGGSTPARRSFLGLPVVSSAHLYGWLYLVDKVGTELFNEADEQLMGMLSGQLAAIYENWQQSDKIQRHVAQLEQELTARKQAEAMAHHQRELLQVTLASIGDAVIATDPEGTITFMNPVAQRLTGWQEAEAIEKQLAEVFKIINEETRQPAANPVVRTLREGVIVGLANHTLLLRRDGSEIPIDDSSAPIQDMAGNLWGAVLVFRDITERRQIEEALRFSRDQLRVILDGVADGIIARDVTGRLVYANDAAAWLTGYPSAQALLAAPPDEVAQRFEILDQAGQPFAPDQFPGRLAAQGKRPPPVVLRFRVVGTGEERWSYVKARPVFNAQGQVELAVTIFQDITEVKRAEQTQRFLAEAGQLLVSSLDYETTLARVAQLAVPDLADWCAVDIVQEGETIQRLAVAHIDPAKVAFAHELQRRYPPDWNAPAGVPHVLRTGQSELYPEITDAVLEASARDAEALRIARELKLRSAMIVPLMARGRTLGAMTFVWAESGRRYGLADLALAEELARRAAMAVDNARLYREAQQFNAELEQRVLKRTAELQASHLKLEAEIIERQKAEEKFRGLLGAAPDGIVIIDREGRIVLVNSQTEQLFGYTRPELLGQSVEILIPERFRAKHVIHRTAYLADARVRPMGMNLELYGLHKTGQEFPVEISLSPLQTEEEFLVISAIRDITLRRELEVELEEIQRRLVESRERDRLRLAKELHDGPVQDLYGVAFGLEALKEALDSVGLTQLKVIQTTLWQVINTLRLISSELRPQTLTPFGLERAILSHIERFHETYPALKFELNLTPDGQTLPEGVRLTLFRIYQEVLENIVQHAAATQARIHYSLERGEVVLEIQDNGRGFEVPRRWIDLARQGRVGLIRAMEQAEAIGGRLEVTSTPGAGTTIRVLLPHGE